MAAKSAPYIWKQCPFCHKDLPKGPLVEAGPPKPIMRYPRLLATTPEQERTVKIIETKCRQFACPGRIVSVQAGPMVTQYDFSPDRFTRVRQLKTMHEDLAIAIPAEAVTVMRIPGRIAMAITVPNVERKIVSFKECLPNVVTVRNEQILPINFGMDSVGNPVVEDLTRMPHLLVAGSTGSGKSVLLNNIILSLLHVRNAKQMRMVVIDPKSVELFMYKDVPHLMRPPVCSVFDALGAMDDVLQHVRKRMVMLETFKAKNLAEYNAVMPDEERKLPYIVVVIDEMADIVLQEKKAFTQVMAQLSSLARASGVHVIAATQRPSVDVLSGKIKVNFPARVCFRVPGHADSKTVLGVGAHAEQLMARGDMLYCSPNLPGYLRLHSPLVENSDINEQLLLSLECGHFLRCPADGPPAVPQESGAPKLELVERKERKVM